MLKWILLQLVLIIYKQYVSENILKWTHECWMKIDDLCSLTIQIEWNWLIGEFQIYLFYLFDRINVLYGKFNKDFDIFAGANKTEYNYHSFICLNDLDLRSYFNWLIRMDHLICEIITNERCEMSISEKSLSTDTWMSIVFWFFSLSRNLTLSMNFQFILTLYEKNFLSEFSFIERTNITYINMRSVDVVCFLFSLRCSSMSRLFCSKQQKTRLGSAIKSEESNSQKSESWEWKPEIRENEISIIPFTDQ